MLILVVLVCIILLIILYKPVCRIIKNIIKRNRINRIRSTPSKTAHKFIHITNDAFEHVQEDINHDITPLIDIYEDFIGQALNQPHNDLFLNLRIDGLGYDIQTTSPLNSYIALDTAKPRDGETKKDTIDRVINQSVTHTSDNQNVHDHEIQSDIKYIAAKLNINRTIDTARTVPDEILNYIIICNCDKDKKEKAIQAYDTIRNDGIKILAIDATEQQILSAVWARAHVPSNSDNAENIRLAIVDALSSCIENNKPVCSTGRSTRILASLCLLDSDTSISQLGTAESYKNDILKDAHEMLNNTIKEARESPNTELKRLGDSFDDTSIDASTISDATKQVFKALYESKIDTLSNKYKSHFTPKLRTELMSVITTIL